MGKYVKSNLKQILDKRDISIRKLAEMSNGELKFETLRKLYNNDMKQYQRDTIGLICELLEIELSELLILDVKETQKETT